MELSATEKEELRDALLEAYPSFEDLDQMVYFKLEENLEAIAKSQELRSVILSLFKWATSKGQWENLIKGACKYNPDNPKLKGIYNKYFLFSAPKTNVVSDSQWKELKLVLADIDYRILQETCQATLAYIENIEENLPQIFSIASIEGNESLKILREIFLEKYPLRKKDDIPTILEFVERLVNDNRVTVKDKLKIWLNKIVAEKNIVLPVYAEPKPSSIIPDPYLMIGVDKISTGFTLEAELIPNYQEGSELYESVQILLADDRLVHCSENNLKDCIKSLINEANDKLIQKYKHTNYDLRVELFLPVKYLGKSFDLEKIPADQARLKPIGYQYPFAVRSKDRYLVGFESDKGQYLKKLERKWEFYRQNKKQDIIDRSILCLDSIEEACNWDKLSTDWSRNNKLAVNVAGGLPHREEKQQEFFLSLLRGGVPFSLWNRCPELACKDDIKEQIISLITLDCLSDLRNLFQKVWDLRIDAHDEGETTAKDYLGYHLGFLCDRPDRVPLSLKPVNQYFEPTD